LEGPFLMFSERTQLDTYCVTSRRGSRFHDRAQEYVRRTIPARVS